MDSTQQINAMKRLSNEDYNKAMNDYMDAWLKLRARKLKYGIMYRKLYDPLRDFTNLIDTRFRSDKKII